MSETEAEADVEYVELPSRIEVRIQSRWFLCGAVFEHGICIKVPEQLEKFRGRRIEWCRNFAAGKRWDWHVTLSVPGGKVPAADFSAAEAERVAALVAFDENWVSRAVLQRNMEMPDRRIVQMTMHKMRWEEPRVPDELRRESGRWLRDRGLKDRLGGEIDPEGQLPE